MEEHRLKRRSFVSYIAGTTIGSVSSLQCACANAMSEHSGTESPMQVWMDDVLLTKSLKGTLFLGRFLDPIYFTLKPTEWRPDKGDTDNLPSVQVPVGFVTDLASIPRIFYSALRPDGSYAHAAVIHDYMYWTQTSSRETADKVLKRAMEYLEINPVTVASIYQAVRLFGKNSWNENQMMKRIGRKRILRKFPTDTRTTWDIWRTQPDVFSD